MFEYKIMEIVVWVKGGYTCLNISEYIWVTVRSVVQKVDIKGRICPTPYTLLWISNSN